MGDILKTIADTKRREVEGLKRGVSLENMRMMALVTRRPVNSMKGSLAARPLAIIAEHKRRSPSKGEISPMSDVETIAAGYAMSGAAAMSVLTDAPFFGGSMADLAVARKVAPFLPILRKEFIVDEYQIYEARVYGADAILLIAAMLDADTLRRFHDLAHSLGMQTLIEVHHEEELTKVPADADMVGVNNRDLTTFHTDISNSARLIDRLPQGVLKVAESGIKNTGDIHRLKTAGFDAFLIGEMLMNTPAPDETLREVLGRIKD